MACIYCITNQLDGKQYVGQTVQKPSRRFTLHKNQARRGHGHYLHRAMRTHGEEHFTLTVLEECEVERLNKREIFWIAELRTFGEGYNLNEGGQGNRRYKPTFETRQRMKESHWSRSEKRDDCVTRIRVGNTGKRMSLAARSKISESGRGKKRTDEQRIKYSQSKRGNKNPMYGKPIRAKTVAQYTLEGQLVMTHASAVEAAHSLGKSNATAIRNCCQGKSDTSYGFVWRYVRTSTTQGTEDHLSQ